MGNTIRVEKGRPRVEVLFAAFWPNVYLLSVFDSVGPSVASKWAHRRCDRGARTADDIVGDSNAKRMTISFPGRNFTELKKEFNLELQSREDATFLWSLVP